MPTRETALTIPTETRVDNQMDVTRRSVRGLVLVFLLIAPLGCVGDAADRAPVAPSAQTLTITGHITEIEDGNLSVRALDGRQFIFTLEGVRLTEAELRSRMENLVPITLTYRKGVGKLIPLNIEDAVLPSPSVSATQPL